TLLLMVHGLCMHDGRWGDAEHDMTAELARGLRAVPLSVRYNSGRHVSQNGRDLAGLLDRLASSRPSPRRLVLVAHSMGGLVARSALEVARVEEHEWLGLEVELVTLGTPHHGAPLERLGNVVDGLLGSNRFFEPYARLGKARSAGVTDLRFGSVHEDDWADRDRFERGEDRRRHVPLPAGVDVYMIAASPTGADLPDRTLGDGLVRLDSALGRHPDPERVLEVAPDRQHVLEGINHFDLVRSPAVTARVLGWLAR
ncbi:alpha/beta fold hydrolase, partial [Rubrivirga sp.]|uniref:alpha/beta fold hydrolase n=1 Tax=Rubrivirga sp. TaxID=1885344 RepID=UPI003C75C31C